MAQVAACRSCIPLWNPEMQSRRRDSRSSLASRSRISPESCISLSRLNLARELHLALESRPGPEHRSNRLGSRTQSGRGTVWVSRQRHNERVMPPHLDAPFRAPRGAICDNGIFYSPSVSMDLRSRHGGTVPGGWLTETRKTISAFENALPVNCIAVHILHKESTRPHTRTIDRAISAAPRRHPTTWHHNDSHRIGRSLIHARTIEITILRHDGTNTSEVTNTRTHAPSCAHDDTDPSEGTKSEAT